jgi:hypothetical protein
MTYVNECCICHDYKDINHKWYTPTTEERRINHIHGKKITHGYCLPCMVINAERDGFSKSEIEEIVKTALEIK